jgi:hypothetical protein
MVDAPHTNKNKATVLVIARVCVLCMSEFEAPKKNRHQARYLFDVNECMLRGICMHRAVLYARCATYSATYSAQHVARHIPRSMLRDMFRATCTYSAQHALVNFEKIYPDTARIARNMLMNARSLNKKKRGLQDLLFYPNHWGHTRSGLQMVYGSHLPRTWLSIKGP